MSSNDIVNKIIEEDKQQPQIKPIGEPESYLTTFKGVQGFLFNVCKNLGEAKPSKSLGVADFLRKYIRFVRIRPEARGQKAPLYFYHPDKGIWIEDNELLQDLISTIQPDT